MKKVMFYCHAFYPQSTGYSNAFQNLIRALLEKDKDLFITVVTPLILENNIDELDIKHLKIIRVQPKINIRKIRYFYNEYYYAKYVSQLFKNEKYDLLFVETFDQSIFLNFLDNELYNKTVVRIHSTNETEYTIFSTGISFWIRKYIITNKLLKKIKWILSTNSFHIEFAKRFYFKENVIDIANTTFFVLPNTINLIAPKEFLPSSKLKFFLLGRMDYLGNNQKGFTDFIYALKLLETQVLDKLDITIVGKGNMRESLIGLCEELNNINFIEELPHDDIVKKLQDSDVVVLPSRYEGLSMFALEALATGNVCLFSNTGGLIDMVDGNGLLFEPQNIESLMNAIKDITTREDTEIIEMKKKSLEICKTKFSSDAVALKFSTIFKLITEG